jgi:hypothetical protein
MQALYLLGVTLLIFILLFVLQSFTKEGFGMNEDRMHNKFSDTYQQKYSNIGVALMARNNVGALGGDTRNLLGNVVSTMDDNNKVVNKVKNSFPTEGTSSGLFALIKKCEAVKTADCNAFDDPAFNKDCGICLDIGTNNEGKSATGGLVLISDDKKYLGAKPIPAGNLIRDYDPTVGTCPAKRMVSNKAECLRMVDQIKCEKNTTYGSPNGCSQCYDADGNYLVLQPDSTSKVSGTLYVVGSGNFVMNDIRRTLSKTRPLVITISNTDGFGSANITVEGIPVPEPYDNGRTYAIGDMIIFNTGIYRMREGVGAAGYSPARQGDKLWELKGALSDYEMPSTPFIAGYLASPDATGSSDTGYFNIDFYRLVLNDAETGRKPRVTKTIKVNGVDVTRMEAGYRKTRMSLATRYPFVFADPMSQEATVCVSSPFVTKQAASEFLQSDPCYAKGSKAGNYNVECLQATFLANGCTEQGKAYPKAATDTSALNYSEGNAQSISEIADKVYAMAVATSTGVDANGTKLSVEDWSAASVFCTGKAITSPCDVPEKNTGPLPKECIVYLWDNQGQNKEVGSTYETSLVNMASSLFSSGNVQRFCTRSGTLSPKNMDGTNNVANINFWTKKGGIGAVKAAMALVHSVANNQAPPEDPEKALAIKQCYGINASSRPTFTSSYITDNTVGVNTSPVTSGPPRTMIPAIVNSPINVQDAHKLPDGSRSGPIVLGQQLMDWTNFRVAATVTTCGLNWGDKNWWGGGSFFNPTPFTKGFGTNDWGNINLNNGVWESGQLRTFFCGVFRFGDQAKVCIRVHRTTPGINQGHDLEWCSNVITGGPTLHFDMSYILEEKVIRVKIAGALVQTADIPFKGFQMTEVDNKWNFTFKPIPKGPLMTTVFVGAYNHSHEEFCGTINYLYVGPAKEDNAQAAPQASSASSGSTRSGGPGWNL